jgi:chorismate dehydratase
MKPKLGCVPYLNATPLIAWFMKDGAEEADIYFDQPSNLGRMVNFGALDAAIASSYFVLCDPELMVAPSVSISSNGPVESVRLFSKKPFDEIESLALDTSSMTSNHLAQIILKHRFGRKVTAQPKQPDIDAMLAEFDAAVLIGDNGMLTDDSGLHTLDLGEAWFEMTSKPFVWALWIGKSGLTQNVREALVKARDYGLRNLIEISENAARERDIAPARAYRYLSESIDFELTNSHLQGFMQFGKLCVEMGFINEFAMPQIAIEPSAGATAS